MAEVFLDIKRWGNNLGVRLPAAVARAAHLHADQRVRVSVEDGLIVIRPETEAPLTLEQRLAQFDPERHGGEAMATKPVGAERW
jgi:antitoxin MazE